MKVMDAKGQRGYLIWTANGYYFRVYAEGSFKDYRLLHTDLYIEILDEDAELYEYDGEQCLLDHSRQTLGKDIESK